MNLAVQHCVLVIVLLDLFLQNFFVKSMQRSTAFLTKVDAYTTSTLVIGRSNSKNIRVYVFTDAIFWIVLDIMFRELQIIVSNGFF